MSGLNGEYMKAIEVDQSWLLRSGTAAACTGAFF